MYYVVGSGPSGVFAALALVEAGAQVTMLDVGRQCEPDRLRTVEALARLSPEAWPDDLLARIEPPNRVGVERKLCYGSDFAYADDAQIPLSQHGTSCLQSYARGGLSNVWGAAVLPFLAEDMAGWPITHDELAPHYRRVADFLGIAGVRDDDLEGLFPYYQPPRKAPRLSRQARWLLDRMRLRRDQLRSDGFYFGQSRLAVRTEDNGSGHVCRKTGRCLEGCPYMAIWSAGDVLRHLQRHPNFTYLDGVQIGRVASDQNGVRLYGRRTDTGEPAVFEGERALLACGPLATASIVAASLGSYGVPLRLQYQPYFLLPMLAAHNIPDVDRERPHALAQLFVGVRDDSISPHPVHLQVYTYNSLLRTRIEQAARLFGPWREWAARQILGRALIMQGYLHSGCADGIDVVPEQDIRAGTARLRLVARRQARARQLVRRVVTKLVRHTRDMGALALMPWLRHGLPGEGNHIGGIFPMRERPSRFETDVCGSLPELPRIHLVDASVLPDLPATTFTYTVMANAHRIATTTVDMA